MTRHLPIVQIAGTAFYVDVLHDELRQKDDPDNRISFNVFDQNGDGYTFLYDNRRKNVPLDRDSIQRMDDGLEWVTIPALMELDPEGIALKYEIPLSILCPDLSRLEDQEDENEFYDDGI